jgi:repressor LexA
VDIPIMGTGSAGASDDAHEEPVGCLTLDTGTLGTETDAPTFALRVPDDSLATLHVCRGDTVVCQGDLTPVEGDIVAALIDGETALRVWTAIDGEPRLTLPGEGSAVLPAEAHLLQGVMVALVRQDV